MNKNSTAPFRYEREWNLFLLRQRLLVFKNLSNITNLVWGINFLGIGILQCHFLVYQRNSTALPAIMIWRFDKISLLNHSSRIWDVSHNSSFQSHVCPKVSKWSFLTGSPNFRLIERKGKNQHRHHLQTISELSDVLSLLYLINSKESKIGRWFIDNYHSEMFLITLLWGYWNRQQKDFLEKVIQCVNINTVWRRKKKSDLELW